MKINRISFTPVHKKQLAYYIQLDKSFFSYCKNYFLLILIFITNSMYSQYSFFDYANYAKWESSIIDHNSNALRGTTSKLNFGESSGANGEAAIKNSVMENGKSYKVLFTHPKWKKNGTIKGWFPPIQKLPKNSKLNGNVGFVKPNGSPGTDGARFMIYIHYYVNGVERWKPIVNIYKKYTGKLASFSYDLSEYAGQKVYFELRVDAGSSAGQDWAAWVYPRITQSYSYADLQNSSNRQERLQPFPKPLPDNSNNNLSFLIGKTFFIESVYNLIGTSRFLEVDEIKPKGSNGNTGVFKADLYQQFSFENAGEGYFYIRQGTAMGRKKYLDVVAFKNRIKEDGQRLISGSVNGTSFHGKDSQKWELISKGNNEYYIKSKTKNVYLNEGYFKGKESGVFVNNPERRGIQKWIFHDKNGSFVFKREFKIKRIKELCPTTRVSGDGEFASNGPKVFGEIDMVINRNALDAIVKFNARETKSDWSHVKGEWVKRVLTLPRSWKINKIIYPNRKSTFNYITNGMPTQGFQFSDNGVNMPRNGFAKSMRFVGDTGGNDISDDNNCHDDTKITFIDFKPVMLEIIYRR